MGIHDILGPRNTQKLEGLNLGTERLTQVGTLPAELSELFEVLQKCIGLREFIQENEYQKDFFGLGTAPLAKATNILAYLVDSISRLHGGPQFQSVLEPLELDEVLTKIPAVFLLVDKRLSELATSTRAALDETDRKVEVQVRLSGAKPTTASGGGENALAVLASVHTKLSALLTTLARVKESVLSVPPLTAALSTRTTALSA